MPPVGFEPTVSADERPQTYVLDREASGSSMLLFDIFKIKNHEKFKYHIIYFPVFSF
jgi:hypothetical protein